MLTHYVVLYHRCAANVGCERASRKISRKKKEKHFLFCLHNNVKFCNQEACAKGPLYRQKYIEYQPSIQNYNFIFEYYERYSIELYFFCGYAKINGIQ